MSEDMVAGVRRLEAIALLSRACLFFTRAQSDSDTELAGWAERFGYALGILGASEDEVTAAAHTAWDCFAAEDWKRVFGV